MRAVISDKSIKAIIGGIIDAEDLADEDFSAVADIISQFLSDLRKPYIVYVGKYIVTLWTNPHYDRDIFDETEFERIIEKKEGAESESIVCVTANDGNERRRAALIVPGVTVIEKEFAPLGDKLFFVAKDTMCLFDPETADIVRTQKIMNYDPEWDYFYVHPYKDDLILYGETKIFRIDKDLNTKWVFRGKEAFGKLISKESPFEWKDDRICIQDYEENRYEIGYDGKLISGAVNYFGDFK